MIDKNSDLNRKIHNRINRNNRRNRRNRMIVLTCLLVSLITGTVMSSPATAMTDDTETQADKGADEVASADEDSSSDEVNSGSESSGDEAQNSSNGEENSDSVQDSSDGNNDSSDGQNSETPSSADEQAGGSSAAQQGIGDISQQSGDSSNAGQNAGGESGGAEGSGEGSASDTAGSDNSAAGTDAVTNSSAADTAATGLTDPAAAADTAEIAETADTEAEAEEKEGEKELTAESDEYKVSAVRTDDERFPYGAQLEVKSLSDDERQSASALIADDLKKENTDKSDVAYKEASGLSDAARNVVSAVKGVVTGSKENDSDGAAAEDGKNLASKTTTSTITTYKAAGIVGVDLSAVYQGMEEGDDHEDGDAVEIDGDIDYTAEFRNDPDFAGFAKKEEREDDKVSTDSDGNQVTTSSTKTTETSWRLYRLESDDKSSDGGAEDGGDSVKDVYDITGDDHTDLTTDSDSHLQKVAFRSSLGGQFAAVQVEKITEVTRTVTDYAQEEKISMPAVTFNEKADTAAGKVTVSVDAPEGAFPEGTTMQVKPVTADSVLDKAVDAAGGRGEAVAVDISFRAADGNEIEPQKKISVRMTSDVIGTAKTARAVHIDDKGDASIVAKKSGDGEKKSGAGSSTSSFGYDENKASEEDGSNVLSFTSKSFSVYAIVYTVDFSFSGYTYSIKGESSIMLSDLAKKLKLYDDEQDKDFAIDDVDSVSFSDESLVKVTKKDGDWELKSLKPFSTTETLTINMKDGSRYEVTVKDAGGENVPQDITGNLTSATIKIDGKDVTDGEWDVKANNSYVIALSFTEEGKNPFPNDGTWMVYKVPKGLKVDDLDTTFDVVVDGKTISGNRMVVDKTEGLIKLQWNISDPNFNTLIATPYLNVGVEIHASFDANAKEIQFSDTVEREVKVDSTHNASVSKTGWYKNSDGKIHYIVTVNSSGTSKNVIVTDNITGAALTYDDGSVQYPSEKNITINKNGNGFTATIPSMSDGEQVQFKYTASVNFDKLSGTITTGDTSNEVKIKCDDDNNPKDNSVTQSVTNISVSSVSKYAKGVSDTHAGKDGRTYRDITWTINANPERKKQITYISDSINPDSRGIMTYSGEGLTIVVTKENGTTEERKVPWGDIQKTDTGWTYRPPKDDGNASYEVTYTTKADVTDLNNDVTVKNNAATDNSSATGNASVGPTTENKISGSKVAEKVTEDEVTWAITVNVPARGLDKLVVTDTLPCKWNNKPDSFGKIISVNGIDNSTEDCVVDTSDSSKFTMTFYKDKGHQYQGLNSSTSNRTITIRYTTTNNREWLKDAEENPDLKAHINNAEIQAPGVSTQVSAIAYPSAKKVKKTGKLESIYTDSRNQQWQLLSYDITLSGVTEDSLILEDTFDTKYFQHFDGQYNGWKDDNAAGAIYGGDQYNQGDGPSKVTVTRTDTGIEIRTGSLPRRSDGSLYGYYRIHYYLKIRLDDLQKLAVENGGTKTLSNSVQWGTKGAEADISYSYPGVNKTFYMKGNVAFYTIDVNPSALKLNEGNPMKLVDTFENQVVDYSTIDIKDQNGKPIDPVQYPYDFSGNQMTFTIPDSTHVTITYQARPVGQVGSEVTMTNKAVMKAYQSDTSNQMEFGGSASGSGEIYHLHLMKYEDGKAGVRLPGAVFQLFDENEKALQYNLGTKNGQDITFTTDKKGDADIRLSAGDEYSKGLEPWKTYKLKEITAPKGYQPFEGYISFKISKDGSVDPEQNLYANGGTLPVPDKKITRVSITLKKVDSGNAAKALQGAAFTLYGSDYVGEDGAVNASARAIESEMRTDSNGTVLLGTLDSGTYYLVETEAPEGYLAEKSPITVVISDEKAVVVQGTTSRDYNYSKKTTDGTTVQTATIEVSDSAGYVLPSTGGPGSRQWQEMGMFLLLSGAVLISGKLLASEKKERGGEL